MNENINTTVSEEESLEKTLTDDQKEWYGQLASDINSMAGCFTIGGCTIETLIRYAKEQTTPTERYGRLSEPKWYADRIEEIKEYLGCSDGYDTRLTQFIEWWKEQLKSIGVQVNTTEEFINSVTTIYNAWRQYVEAHCQSMFVNVTDLQNENAQLRVANNNLVMENDNLKAMLRSYGANV